LKVIGSCPGNRWSEPTNTQINFTRYPRLKWFKLCGETPPQFQDIFEGQATNLKRCIIGHKNDTQKVKFRGKATSTFFSRFAENLEAMIIYSGDFDRDIPTVFPKLHSLKVYARSITPNIIMKNCPQLVQLSLVHDRSGWPRKITEWLSIILPFYDLTVQNLQLITSPMSSLDGECDEILSREIISTVAFCENLKFLEISGGFAHISKQGCRVLGKGHPELEAVIMNSCESGVKVCIWPRDL
jgi:hypothetical protein